MALHIGRRRTTRLVKALLLRRPRQRPIGARNPNEIGSADYFLDVCDPGRIGGIGGAPVNNLAAYEAGAGGALRYKTGRHAEADYGHAALGS